MKSVLFSLSFVLVVSMQFFSTASAYPIAGVNPDQRPAGAPVIKTFQKNDQWYANALHGITLPYPASLHFLENQGGWYTPFIHRGMTGPYDIRNWHK